MAPSPLSFFLSLSAHFPCCSEDNESFFWEELACLLSPQIWLERTMEMQEGGRRKCFCTSSLFRLCFVVVSRLVADKRLLLLLSPISGEMHLQIWMYYSITRNGTDTLRTVEYPMVIEHSMQWKQIFFSLDRCFFSGGLSFKRINYSISQFFFRSENSFDRGRDLETFSLFTSTLCCSLPRGLKHKRKFPQGIKDKSNGKDEKIKKDQQCFWAREWTWPWYVRSNSSLMDKEH